MSAAIFFLALSLLVLAGAFLFYYFADNPAEREPVMKIIGAFALGIATFMAERSIVRPAIMKLLSGRDALEFAIRINDEYLGSAVTVSQAAFSGFIIGGLIKEGVKWCALEALINRWRREVDEPIDCIIYAGVLSLGFTLGDVALHVIVKNPFGVSNIVFVLDQMFANVVGAVLMGYWFARYDMSNNSRRWGWLLAAWLVAALAHGLAAFFAAFHGWLGGVGLIFLVVTSWGCLQLVRELRGKGAYDVRVNRSS